MEGEGRLKYEGRNNTLVLLQERKRNRLYSMRHLTASSLKLKSETR
jgi:hypothetical protein